MFLLLLALSCTTHAMSTQFLMALACMAAVPASSLAQVTANLGQNIPARVPDTGTKLRLQPPIPSEIPTVPRAVVPPAVVPPAVVPPAVVPPASPTQGATPDLLYNPPRQRERDPAAAEQPKMVGPSSLRADGFPDTIGVPAPAPVQMEGMPYEFEWSVRDAGSGSLYSHQERSDGRVARGQYRVLLPDGRLQVVTFTDRGQGYEAQVVYQDYDGF